MATKNLAATITIGGTVTAGLKGALGSTTTALKGIGTEIGKIKDRQRQLNDVLRQAERAGKFGNAAGYAISELRDVETRLNRLRQAQTRLNDAIKRGDALNATAGKMRSVGAGMTVAGGATLAGVAPLIGNAIKRENEINIIKNSGLSEHDQKGLIDAAKNAKQFGVSTTDAFKTVRELQASLGSAHHAIEALPDALKAKSGLQLYNRNHAGHEIGEEAMYSLAKIADERGGATSAEAMRVQMNAAFKGITAAQGKVTAEDWLNAQRGAKAAGIGMKDDAFFGDSFMVQALGAPQYGKALSTLNNAWIGGHQDAHKFYNMAMDGLVDKSKVTLGNGVVKKYSSDALIDSKLLIEDQQAWVEKHLIPLAQRKGVSLTDSAAVQKFVSDYTSNPNAGNVLFQRLYNKTAIERDRKNYVTAPGIDASDKANQESSAGKQADAQARLNDAMSDFGNNILPMYTKALLAASDALKSLNDFTEKHGTLAKAAGVAIVGIGVSLTTLGPILTIAGAGLSAYAAYQMRAAAAAASAAAAIGTETAAIEAQNAAAGGGKMGKLARFAGKAGLAGVAASLALEGAKAAGLPEVDQAKGEQEFRDGHYLAASAHMSAGSFLKSIFTGAPEAPGLRGAGAAAAPVTNNNTFNVTQQPGESQEALARRIAEQLQRQQAVQQRGALTDGASHQ
jgi:hypothetical protein